jgi:hypothetical protein
VTKFILNNWVLAHRIEVPSFEKDVPRFVEKYPKIKYAISDRLH